MKAQTENVEGERAGRAFSEVWDITKSPYPGTYKPKAGGEETSFGQSFADAAMLLFCLSAIPPAKFDKRCVDSTPRSVFVTFCDDHL